MHEVENNRQEPLRISISYTFTYKNVIELKIIRFIFKKVSCYKRSESKTSNKYNHFVLLGNCGIEAKETYFNY